MGSEGVLRAATRFVKELGDIKVKWAIAGDTAEMVSGTDIETDHLEILTTLIGTTMICRALAESVTKGPSLLETRLERDAHVSGKTLPVHIRSRYAELELDGVRIQLYGDLQYRVGAWDWGEPIDYEPDYVQLAGYKVPVVPLALRTELATSLGWSDRAGLTSGANLRNGVRKR